MKKQCLVILFIFFSFVFIGKSNCIAQEEKSVMTSSNKSLVIYYSLTNNTKKLAKFIQNEKKADCYEISLFALYLPVLKDVFSSNKQESQTASTKCLHAVENFDAYDTIYLGFPIWFNDMPFFVYKFLSSYDFSDKEVRVFITAGSSSLGSIMDNISSVLPRAKVSEPMLVNNASVKTAEELAKDWLNTLTYAN